MPGSGVVGAGSRKVIVLLITSNIRLLYETEKSIIAPP